jgi:hypothetical protein
MMQTAVMGTKYRSGFHFIFDLRINLDMISQVPVGGPLPTPAQLRSLVAAELKLHIHQHFTHLMRCRADGRVE